MIDYIKILLLNIDIDRLLNLSFLDFKSEFSEKTGEILTKVSKKTGKPYTKRTAEYHFCKITVYDTGIVLFTGSIHKLWNSLNDTKAPNYKDIDTYKGFNGNQFALENIIESRNHLENLFDCKPQQMLFQNVEFGVNTTPTFNPKLYIKGLLYHNNKLFEYRFNGNSAQAEHQRFILKIYNKSIQYGMSEFTLRIELKITKAKELKITGIRTFADVNSQTLDKAKQMLLNRFDEVMHYDYTIIKKLLTKTQNQLLKSYSNPRYWINDLESNHRDRHKKRLKEITIKYSENLHQHLMQNIIQKCVIINRLSESSKCVINTISNIKLNITQIPTKISIKKCIVTGIELTHENADAIYIKTSTFKYLREYEKNTYMELCSFLLSNTKGNPPKFERGIIPHLNKQVRNRLNNQSTIRQIGYKQKIYHNQLGLNL